MQNMPIVDIQDGRAQQLVDLLIVVLFVKGGAEPKCDV